MVFVGLFDSGLPVGVAELPVDLAALDRLLDDRALLAPIERARASNSREFGRPSIPMDRFVRLMVIKARSGGWGTRRWSGRSPHKTNRRLAKFRVGCEGRISHLKRRCGMRRSRLKGHDGARTRAAWAILTYNLDTLAIRIRDSIQPEFDSWDRAGSVESDYFQGFRCGWRVRACY